MRLGPFIHLKVIQFTSYLLGTIMMQKLKKNKKWKVINGKLWDNQQLSTEFREYVVRYGASSVQYYRFWFDPFDPFNTFIVVSRSDEAGAKQGNKYPRYEWISWKIICVTCTYRITTFRTSQLKFSFVFVQGVWH